MIAKQKITPFLALNGSPQMSKLDIAALQRAYEGP